MVITLEPFDGLDAVSENDCKDFAALCARYEKLGLGVMVRFAHEMNGSWYPWCQQPTLYKEKFQLLAQYVHAKTQNAAMLWAPNSGGSYPFSGGAWEATPGTADYPVLDTDGNNRLDMNDDMFTPYYPGDDAVDWVG
jgi:beta-mannanase